MWTCCKLTYILHSWLVTGRSLTGLVGALLPTFLLCHLHFPRFKKYTNTHSVWVQQLTTSFEGFCCTLKVTGSLTNRLHHNTFHLSERTFISDRHGKLFAACSNLIGKNSIHNSPSVSFLEPIVGHHAKGLPHPGWNVLKWAHFKMDDWGKYLKGIPSIIPSRWRWGAF